MTPYNRVVAALRANNSIRKGDNWQCPAHDDRTPSLSVKRATDQETGEPIVLLFCHAGCSTTDAILPKLGIEPSELFSGAVKAGAQTALFPPTSYSPIGLDIMRKFPASPTRSLLVASRLGRFVSPTGGRERVYSTREIAAVIVESKHRKAVRNWLGISAGALRNDIMDWRAWGVAHACSRGLVAIFIREVETCPICKASLIGDGGYEEPSLIGDVRPPQVSPASDGFEAESVTTDPGFFKGLGDPEEESSSLEGSTETPLQRKRRFDPYPEVTAMEAAYLRLRKAGSE